MKKIVLIAVILLALGLAGCGGGGGPAIQENPTIADTPKPAIPQSSNSLDVIELDGDHGHTLLRVHLPDNTYMYCIETDQADWGALTCDWDGARIAG